MKIYPKADVNFFVDKLSTWEHCSRYPPNQTWERKPKDDVRFVNFYRDYEPPRRTEKFTRHCYYLKEFNWNDSRIKPWACLPIFYASGNRFIKIEKKEPLGFKCAEFPMNLKEFRNKVIELEQKAQADLQKRLFQKALREKCKKRKKPKKR